MSDQDENGQQAVIDGENSDYSIIEVDITNLSNEQKSALKIVLLSLLIELIVMAGIRFITDIFKVFMRDPYKTITDYVANYFSTLTPYFFTLVLILLLYQVYLIITNDTEIISDFSAIFEILTYVLLGVITLIVIFGSINAPTYAELSIFVFTLLLLVFIYFLPANYYNSRIGSSEHEKDSE